MKKPYDSNLKLRVISGCWDWGDFFFPVHFSNSNLSAMRMDYPYEKKKKNLFKTKDDVRFKQKKKKVSRHYLRSWGWAGRGAGVGAGTGLCPALGSRGPGSLKGPEKMERAQVSGLDGGLRLQRGWRGGRGWRGQDPSPSGRW